MIEYQPSPELIAVEALAKAGADPDALSDACTEHLATILAGELSATSRLKLEDIARLMKFSTARPLPSNAIARLRAWPAARLAELAAAIAVLKSEIQADDIEKMNDAIGREISRAYS